ncbi:hypothetical protein KSAC_34850 (plasmid) [Komagataeibacter saccharivorans]|nr:hypothetical protein KSAC_34850 [Komagataeibacter saccharivorans]
MDCKVSDHPTGYELLPHELAYQGHPVIRGKFTRDGHLYLPRKLRIDALLGGLNLIP